MKSLINSLVVDNTMSMLPRQLKHTSACYIMGKFFLSFLEKVKLVLLDPVFVLVVVAQDAVSHIVIPQNKSYQTYISASILSEVQTPLNTF